MQKYGNAETPQMNIWLAVWVKPRQAVRYAIQNKKMSFAVMLIMIAGFFEVLDQASAKNMGDNIQIGVIFLMALIIGPIAAMIGWYIGSGINYLVGKLLGGKGTYADLQMAFAVSSIILIIGSLIWVPDLIIVGRGMFTEYADFNIFQGFYLLMSAMFSIVIAIWAFVANVFAIAEAHRFSAWRGLATIAIPAVIIILVLLALFAIIFIVS